ncbi:MAG TPA: two pore domain potassium channel family protein [Rhodospirillales bacterium]|nr:two pore domain potassium channel family protein [Rhodospirillales bacterium]
MLSSQLVIGSAMLAVTVVLHVGGVVLLISGYRYRRDRSGHRETYTRATLLLVGMTLGILLLHTVEIWLWALLYVGLGEFRSLEAALYFSTVTFTTLGYGDLTLDERWRILSSLEAVNGLLLFGISTALLVAVVRRMLTDLSMLEEENATGGSTPDGRKRNDGAP